MSSCRSLGEANGVRPSCLVLPVDEPFGLGGSGRSPTKLLCRVLWFDFRLCFACVGCALSVCLFVFFVLLLVVFIFFFGL